MVLMIAACFLLHPITLKWYQSWASCLHFHFSYPLFVFHLSFQPEVRSCCPSGCRVCLSRSHQIFSQVLPCSLPCGPLCFRRIHQLACNYITIL